MSRVKLHTLSKLISKYPSEKEEKYETEERRYSTIIRAAGGSSAAMAK